VVVDLAAGNTDVKKALDDDSEVLDYMGESGGTCGD
jgi:hypothetical protein